MKHLFLVIFGLSLGLFAGCGQPQSGDGDLVNQIAQQNDAQSHQNHHVNSDTPSQNQ